jgi:hypothetical protein
MLHKFPDPTERITIPNEVHFENVVTFEQLVENPVLAAPVADATPSVLNTTRIKLTNTSPVTITNFREGQEGQTIYLIGDGQTSVAHNTDIKTHTGSTILLEIDKVYIFLKDGAWKELHKPSVARLPIPFSFHADGSANITLTNQATAEQFLGNSNRNITVLDLSGKADVKLVARIVTNSASVNSPRIIAKYRTTFSTTVGDYVNIGTSEVSCSMSSTGIVQTSWIPLAAGARIASCFVTITQIGGDAAADPALGPITLWVR